MAHTFLAVYAIELRIAVFNTMKGLILVYTMCNVRMSLFAWRWPLIVCMCMEVLSKSYIKQLTNGVMTSLIFERNCIMIIFSTHVQGNKFEVCSYVFISNNTYFTSIQISYFQYTVCKILYVTVKELFRKTHDASELVKLSVSTNLLSSFLILRTIIEFRN